MVLLTWKQFAALLLCTSLIPGVANAGRKGKGPSQTEAPQTQPDSPQPDPLSPDPQTEEPEESDPTETPKTDAPKEEKKPEAKGDTGGEVALGLLGGAGAVAGIGYLIHREKKIKEKRQGKGASKKKPVATAAPSLSEKARGKTMQLHDLFKHIEDNHKEIYEENHESKLKALETIKKHFGNQNPDSTIKKDMHEAFEALTLETNLKKEITPAHKSHKYIEAIRNVHEQYKAKYPKEI